jgi:hypothetical protein
VADFHLEEVRGVVDEGHNVPFSCHGEYPLVQDFVQNIMRKCPWSQPVMLGRFDYIFVMVHHGLEFLLDGIHKFGGEPDVGFQQVCQELISSVRLFLQVMEVSLVQV